ncbi:MAG: hypothetical protein K8R92_06410 [Planctomycetes bacterium]|nr:hypothetical protein [Planctomycetota bacterium]
MKMHALILALVAACSITLFGCDGSGSIDTTQLQHSFANAEAGLKSAADTAVTAIKKADYSGALADLQKIAGDAKLTPEQKTAVNNVIEQVKKMISDMAAKAQGDASKALGGVPKAP